MIQPFAWLARILFGSGPSPPRCPHCGFGLKPVRVVEIDGKGWAVTMPEARWYCNLHDVLIYFRDVDVSDTVKVEAAEL